MENKSKKDVSLYFHIPFCTKKCPYCHFYVIPDKQEYKEILLEALSLEWKKSSSLLVDKNIVSIYFGGGTPSLFGAHYIQEILSWIKHTPSCEITIEANPEKLSEESITAYLRAGINRLSIGVQSLDDKILEKLGRGHSAQRAIDSVNLSYELGIKNISIDLMYEVPGQTLKSWENTLLKLSEIPISHLSLYNLTIEPETVFFKNKESLTPQIPAPQESLQMLKTAVKELEKIGLNRYEISAFARPGFESRHNLGYWQGRCFLGFGPSAFSYWGGRRFQNIAHLKKYAEKLHKNQSPVSFEETLSSKAQMHEMVAVGLRVLEGIDRRQFPVDPKLFSDLESKGLIRLEGNNAKLTDEGILFYDSVAEMIIL